MLSITEDKTCIGREILINVMLGLCGGFPAAENQTSIRVFLSIAMFMPGEGNFISLCAPGAYKNDNKNHLEKDTSTVAMENAMSQKILKKKVFFF